MKKDEERRKTKKEEGKRKKDEGRKRKEESIQSLVVTVSLGKEK